MKCMFYWVPHAVIFPSLLTSSKEHSELQIQKTNPYQGRSTEQSQFNKSLHVFFIQPKTVGEVNVVYGMLGSHLRNPKSVFFSFRVFIRAFSLLPYPHLRNLVIQVQWEREQKTQSWKQWIEMFWSQICICYKVGEMYSRNRHMLCGFYGSHPY